MYQSLFIFLLGLTSFSSLADSLNLLQKKKEISDSEMSGYRFSDFSGFEKKWNLVTVRYRKDTGEMRLTYANDIAFAALTKGIKDYPDGAAFGKIGIKTKEDPAFLSSAVPSGARRYQLMIKNQARHAKTEGWGYALFDQDGKLFPEKEETQVRACAACHRIVPERGYVFSQLMQLSPGSSPVANNQLETLSPIGFKKIAASGLGLELKKALPRNTKTIMLVDHEISQSSFQGTFDEVRPLLSRQAFRSKLPAALVNPKTNAFSLVYIEDERVPCQSDGLNGTFMKAVTNRDEKYSKVYEINFCYTDN